MNPEPITSMPPPGPGFIATLNAATGIHHASGYDLAQLLITHPGPRYPNETTETIEDGMRSLAAALHLGPGTEDPPAVGPRLLVRHWAATLDYGHTRYGMTIPAPSRDWLALLSAGALCRICLVIAPLARTAGRDEADVHLRECLTHGLVRWGITYARRRF